MSQKLSSILSNYFENDAKPKGLTENFSLVQKQPIQASSFSWSVHENPERFSKRFKFDTRQRMISFVNEVFEHEDRVRHHCEMRVDYTEVDISVYTHDVNKITELDKEFVKKVDEIHRDVLDFEYK
tara:strand:+ start:390 stop:767 length:378 start_codon:yes stop_codon:yes gene_type:complete